MAQRTKKEETEVKVPDTLTLCINNCGVTGNPATNNMCQKCFNSTTATSSSSLSSSAVVSAIVDGGDSIGSILKKTPRSSFVRSLDRSGTLLAASVRQNREADVAAEEKKSVNRCSGCRRKVGLTGFRCRCGDLFCAEHRYSDRHDCSYDYKAAGREAIARENPLVKPAKILKV